MLSSSRNYHSRTEVVEAAGRVPGDCFHPRVKSFQKGQYRYVTCGSLLSRLRVLQGHANPPRAGTCSARIYTSVASKSL